MGALLAACVVAPAAHAATAEYPLPSAERFPIGIAAGPDGAVWAAVRSSSDAGADRIARVSAAGAVTEYVLPAASDPAGIALGPDGALWFAETGAGSIGRIATGGEVTHHALPTAGAKPLEIAPGPDGALWFTESAHVAGGNRVGRIATDGTVTEFCVLCGPESVELGLHSIAAGADGALWFTMKTAGRVGRITPAGVVSQFDLPTPAAEPAGIAAGPDGNVWFTERAGNRVGRITPEGTVTEFQIPTPDSQPVDIAAGPDGRLWFTEYAGNRVGRIDVNGTISESAPLPTAFSAPNRIVAGPGPSLWFTESGAAAVGRITPEPPPVATTGTGRALDLISAEVTGVVDPNGPATSYWFEYGTDLAYGGRTEAVELPAGDDAIDVTAKIAGLTPGYDYHYRLVAESVHGVSTGADRTFTIDYPTYQPPSQPAPVQPAPAQAAAEPAAEPEQPPPPKRPAVSGLRTVNRYFDARGHRRRGVIGLRFNLNMPALVRVSLERRRSAAPPLLLTYKGRRGRNVIRLSERLGRRLRTGFYDTTVIADDGRWMSAPQEVLVVVPRRR